MTRKAGIRAKTVDRAEMYPCPLCGGQVYAKLLYVSATTPAVFTGILSAMCADCEARSTLTLPATSSPTADIDEAYYQSVLDALRIP